MFHILHFLQCEMALGIVNPGSKQFPALSKTQILMDHYYHSLTVDASTTVSKNCPIIGEHAGIFFVTLGYHSNTMTCSFKCLYYKNGIVKFFLIEF